MKKATVRPKRNTIDSDIKKQALICKSLLKFIEDNKDSFILISEGIDRTCVIGRKLKRQDYQKIETTFTQIVKVNKRDSFEWAIIDFNIKKKMDRPSKDVPGQYGCLGVPIYHVNKVEDILPAMHSIGK